MLYLYFLLGFLIVVISVGFLTEFKIKKDKWFNFFYSCCIGWLIITVTMGSMVSLLKEAEFKEIPPPLIYFIIFVLPLITFFLFEVNLYKNRKAHQES